MSTTIILDCDPGIDDALAIAFAVGHQGIELAGITTVAGNVGLDKTTANALAVASFTGAADVPVTPGCAAALTREDRRAGHVHGESGLGGAVLPPPRRRAEDGHAIDFIISRTAAAPGEITLVATGPLTNIGLALRREPRLAEWVRDFVIMGGSAGRGNVTPAAEFNIWADPEAAAIVFGAGWTVRMIGLDVTLRARATRAVQQRMRDFGRLGTDLVLPALSRYAGSGEGNAASGGRPPAPPDKQGVAASGGRPPAPPDKQGVAASGGRPPAPPDKQGGGPPVHDVCAVLSVVSPGVFTYTPAAVQVETTGRLTSGMTVTDFSPSIIPNAAVATDIDVDRFWDEVMRTYASLSAVLG
jgi:inosine-uridine nucleoside N-ribohydrolase